MSKLYLLIGILFLAACGGRQAGSKASAIAKEELKAFEQPNIPSMLTSPEERLNYYISNYWSKFDFSDTAYISAPRITEQAFADFVNASNHAPQAQAGKAFERMLDSAGAGSAMYDYFVELSEKYLYDPNSPMRNEELYIYVLNHIISSPEIGELEKLRPQSQLKMALKNRVGHKAADITFTLASGGTKRLYDIKADYTLLYFYNPECTACAEVMAQIESSPVLSPMVAGGELAVVAIYPDEELDAWLGHAGDIPSAWINGYDASQQIRTLDIYDLKAIPTLYLLDGDKTVIIKDAASAMTIEQYFYEQ